MGNLQTARSQERRRQAALQGIRNGSVNFEDLPEALRDDAEIALTAIRRILWNFEHVSTRLWRNEEFVLAAVKVWGGFLEFAWEQLRGDRKVVLEAVQRNGCSLQFASNELRADRDIVLTAVRQFGGSVWYALAALRDDREIVLAALGSTADAFEVKYVLHFVSDHLLNDPVVAGAILQKGVQLAHGSELMKRLENALFAVRTLPADLTQHVSDEESVVELCRRWECLVWHKIWLLLQLEPSDCVDGIGRLLVELSGLVPLELRQVKELRRCAPVVGAVLSFPGRDWKDLNSYYRA